MAMNKIRNIVPNGITGSHRSLNLKDYDIILNDRMGMRKCNDLHTPPRRDDAERFDIQEFILFMKTVKANTIFTIYYNEKEKDSIEVTLHDIRKVFGRKMKAQTCELEGNYQKQITVIL